MNWNTGYTARYYYTLIDPATWRDIETHDLTGGSIMRVTTGLMQSADMTVTALPSEGEAWVRIYLNATQGSDGAREALFTGLMQAPATGWDGRRREYKATLYSVLKPAEDILLERGWYAPAGLSGARLAADLLEVCVAPVETASASPTLSSNIVAENNETNLSMAWKIIDAIGWRMRISGDGTISIEPKAEERSVLLDPMDNDIVELKLTDTRDWYSCPNVLRVVSGDNTEIARDDDGSSEFSTVARGREIWAEESRPSQNSNESLREYAQRRLKELQSPMRKVAYSRRYLPDIYPGDIVGLHHPVQGIEGEFRIASQKITLGYGAQTSEESEWLT